MASLQELLSRSVTQTLGLSEMLEISQQRALQLGEVSRMKGQVEAARVETAGKVEVENIKAEGRSKHGLFSTIGTLVGAVGGFMVGGPAGASLGAKVGGGLGGAASGVNADYVGSRGGASGLIQGGIDSYIAIDNMGKEMKLKEEDEAIAKEAAAQKQANFQATYDQNERKILNTGGTPPKPEKPDPQIKIQAETDFRGVNDEWGVKLEIIKNPEDIDIKGYEKYKELSSDLLDANEELERTTVSNHEGISASLLASRRKTLSQYINNAEAVLTSKNLTKGWGIGNFRVKDKADKPDEQVFEAVRDGKYDVLADLIGWTPKYGTKQPNVYRYDSQGNRL